MSIETYTDNTSVFDMMSADEIHEMNLVFDEMENDNNKLVKRGMPYGQWTSTLPCPPREIIRWNRWSFDHS